LHRPAQQTRPIVDKASPEGCHDRRDVLQTRENISSGGLATTVPTLFRFIVILAILAGLGYAAMWALATFVEPQPREITTTVPASRLAPR
jgi:hypothetical protein